jgi:hypothetical protein
VSGALASLIAIAAAAVPATRGDGSPAYQYVPFLKPLPAWGDHVWPWLLLPLCLGVAVVYKSLKCQSMRQVPREALVLTIWILAGMGIAALTLGLIVEATEWANA